MAQRLPHSRSLNVERGHFGQGQFRLGEAHGLRLAQRLRLYLITGICTISLVMAEHMSRKDGYPSQSDDKYPWESQFWDNSPLDSRIGSEIGGSLLGRASGEIFPQGLLPSAKAEMPVPKGSGCAASLLGAIATSADPLEQARSHPPCS